MSELRVLSKKKADFLLTLSYRIVPEIEKLDPEGQNKFLSAVDEALAGRDIGLQKQFKLFLDVVKFKPLLGHGRTFDKLKPEVQDKVLRGFEDNKVSLLRSGIWGLRTLIFMGYYGRVVDWEQIGYRPSFYGNEKIHE